MFFVLICALLQIIMLRAQQSELKYIAYHLIGYDIECSFVLPERRFWLPPAALHFAATMTTLLYSLAVEDAAAEGIPLCDKTARVGDSAAIVDTLVLNKSVTEVRESLSVDKVGLLIAEISPFGSVDVCVSIITRVVVFVTVVLWIEGTGKLVIEVEICIDVQACVAMYDCAKVNDWT